MDEFPEPHMAPPVFCCDQFGECTAQSTTTVTVTAKGDEALKDLRAAVAAALPGFRYDDGVARIGNCPAVVVFVNHGPTRPLVSLG